MNIKNRKQSGFTIIEVLIVLAIAGLILLVVFLAVPALQRNSRNTQRKSDISAILGGVSEFVTNNNGTAPAVACNSANPYKFVTGTCLAPTGTAAEFKMGYYSSAPTVQTAQVTAVSTADAVVVVTGVNSKCDTANPGKTLTTGSARGVSALYTIEAGGVQSPVCQES